MKQASITGTSHRGDVAGIAAAAGSVGMRDLGLRRPFDSGIGRVGGGGGEGPQARLEGGEGGEQRVQGAAQGEPGVGPILVGGEALQHVDQVGVGLGFGGQGPA